MEPGSPTRRFSTQDLVLLWLGIGLAVSLIQQLLVCEFLFPLVAPSWAFDAYITRQPDGPPLFQLVELLCGPLWWLVPVILSSIAVLNIRRRDSA